jgi:DNA polymerase-3 subunit delta
MPEIFPIYLFTGNDSYLKREAVDKLKKALLKEKSEAFNFNVYDAGKCDIKEVIDTLRSTPFISGKRLVVLRRIDEAGGNTQSAIAAYAKNPSKDTCLVLESSRETLSGELYNGIKGHAREVPFLSPKNNQVVGWIKKEISSRNKLIRYDAAYLLKELKKDDINGLRSEIDKLITYIGKRTTVVREDVEKLVGSSPSRSVFEFVHALSRKDSKEALAITNELLKTKKAIPEILGMIGWHFRRIKKAKELLKKGASGRNAGIKCKIPPFYIERFIKEIKAFTAKEIDRNIDYLLEADYSIKRGYAKGRDALELLIVKVCGRR